MHLKLFAFILLIEWCLSAPLKLQLDNETIAEIKKSVASLTPECQKVIKNYITSKKDGTEEGSLRWTVKIKTHDPQIYQIMKPIFNMVQKQFEGGEEATEFLKWYYARIDDVKDDSDAEIQRYKDDSRAKWETLSDQAKAEVGKALPATRLYIESN